VEVFSQHAFQVGIKQNDREFNVTMGGIKAEINTITGGNSFCYMEFTHGLIGETSGVPVFVHVGGFPLSGVEARISNLNEAVKKRAPMTLQNFLAGDLKVSIGDLSIASSAMNLSWNVPLSDRNHQDFRVFFVAKNGHWMEDLEIRNVDGHILQAIRVRRIVGNRTPTIYTNIENKFPRNSKNQVEWPK